MPIDLILGTAGHIDHGKTSLIKALTGVDTDRLPEEQKRGITIELGFAELVLGDYRLGIVDVPGHERFVRNMLAGATGMDVALLVVAADDSVKPQTREHLEILRLLDLPAGIIALTKCDSADPDWIDLVELEVRELVQGTFLADAPIVRTSAYSGLGLDELRGALARAAQVAARVRRAREDAPFRMAIDRSFTIAGHGTVVTGSVQSGRAAIGDKLEIQPGGIEVRVRGLQNHDRPSDAIQRGQRAAINLAGVHHEQIGRGKELASPGHLAPSRALTARLHLLDTARRSLKSRSRVHVHLGTAELMASVVVLDAERIDPGRAALVQLFLSAPVVAVWSQPFVVRSESPVETIGGGIVLDPTAAKIRRSQPEKVRRAADLAADDPVERASAALYFAGLGDWQPVELARTAGVDNFQAVAEALAGRGDLLEINLSPTRSILVHRQSVEDLFAAFEKALRQAHAQFPLQRSIDHARLLQRFSYLGSPAIFSAVLNRMAESGRIKLSSRGVALAGHGPQLSKNEQSLLEAMIGTYRQAGYEPPTVAELQKQAAKNQAAVPDLIKLAASEGELVMIGSDLYLHHEVEHRLRETLTEEFSQSEGLSVSQIREILATSRKYAVPICEYLDRIGFTRRHGDLRVLASAKAGTTQPVSNCPAQ